MTAHAILPGMATYTLTPRRDGDGYDIRVVDADGAHHTMLGFKSEADAMAWIARDKKIEDARGERWRHRLARHCCLLLAA